MTELIDAYERGIRELREAVAGLDEPALRARVAPGTWSILEIVCHLSDSEQAWCHRFKRTISEPSPLIISYDEAAFAAHLGYHDRDLHDELDHFEITRRQMAAILRRLPPEAWSRTCVHAEHGKMTLKEMVQIEADHVPHHLKFIAAKRTTMKN